MGLIDGTMAQLLNVIRTPDQRFVDLPGWSFQPRYVYVPVGPGNTETLGAAQRQGIMAESEGQSFLAHRLRIHYVDEGPSHAPVVLLLHGEPSWSYLYRHMIGPLVSKGHRVVAIDLAGFGRSDKPTSRQSYSYASHTFWLTSAIRKIGLRSILLFCQDWGGLLGLRIAAENPHWFRGIVASNTWLPFGEDAQPSKAFLNWRAYSQKVSTMNVGRILQSSTTTDLAPAVLQAYMAPYPDERYQAGVVTFPSLVPLSRTDPAAPACRAAWKALKALRPEDLPLLTCFGDSDPITRGTEKLLKAQAPGARLFADADNDQTKAQLTEPDSPADPRHGYVHGGHFVQEDAGPALAAQVHILSRWIEKQTGKRRSRL